MDTLPEFVSDEKESGAGLPAPSQLTGWETVIFQVDDDPGSDFSSTAAIAP
jgi:hypothetical protein